MFIGLLPSNALPDTLNTTTPLVNQVLLNWLTASYIYLRASDEERVAVGLQKPQGIGYGIGLAFAIFSMQGMLFFSALYVLNLTWFLRGLQSGLFSVVALLLGTLLIRFRQLSNHYQMGMYTLLPDSRRSTN